MDTIKNKILFLVLIISIVSSCRKITNPKDRNTIKFNEVSSNIEDSIKKLNLILEKFNVSNYLYAIDKDYLYINSNFKILNLGHIDSVNTENILWPTFIKLEYRQKFINLIKYLYINQLQRCDVNNSHPFYLYKADIYMSDSGYDLERFIIYSPSISGIDTLNYKILDRKNNLYLLANKEAKIWADD